MQSPHLPERSWLQGVARVRRELNERKGFALIAVLSVTALAMVLVMALLSVSDASMKTESAAWEKTRAQVMADGAVSVALAQIQQATNGQFEDGTPRPWTSQPGGIRTFNMDGTPHELHKLFTASNMKEVASGELNNDLPEGWQSQPDQFVDLNAPYATGPDDLAFPIVDPRAKTLDPTTSVEGFDYDLTHGAVGPTAGEQAQRLPMPVRWIYQRRDGTLAMPNAAGALVPSDSPDDPNPVVARFAYWVDDESCKVNINTAGEGSYWDAPVADTNQERELAKSQPTRREYHRQAGHPAGVCLSSVLLPGRRLYPVGFLPEMASDGWTMQEMSLEDGRDLWRMGRLAVAELGTDTSWAGTVRPDWVAMWDSQTYPITRQGPYANVSELVFDNASPENFPALWANVINNQRRVHPFVLAHPEVVNRLARASFFLTAHSSAPETTLFGTPRVAMWPIHGNTLLNVNGPNENDAAKKDTTYDHKMKFLTQLKGRNYLVVRSEPGHGANDMEVHAQGANKNLLAYLKRLTDKAVPGFYSPDDGRTTFAAKYGDDREAILVEMLDYVRATNFADGQLDSSMQFSVLCPGQEYKGFGQVSPLQAQRVTGSKAATANHPQGSGRIMTISEVALVIVCRAQVDGDGKVQGDPVNVEQLTNKGDRELDVGILVEGFVPGQSWADYRPYISLGLFGGAPGAAPSPVSKRPRMTLNGQELVMENYATDSAELPPAQWVGAGGSVGVRGLSDGTIRFKPIVLKADAEGQVEKLTFSGGSTDVNQLKLALYDAPDTAPGGTAAASDLVQVIPLVMPDFPEKNVAPSLAAPSLPKDIAPKKVSLAERMKEAAKTGKVPTTSTDVVQSLAPVHGDYRLIASQRWVESRDATAQTVTPVFVPNAKWGKELQAHTLRDVILPPGGSTEGFIRGLNYASATRPDMPSSLIEAIAGSGEIIRVWKSGNWTQYQLSGDAGTQAIDSLRLDKMKRGPALPEITGDFDNGLGDLPDGSYVNRPDDGHWAAARDTSKVPYFDNVSQTGRTVPPVSLSTFSPQRLLPSPVMFGSLPTGTRTHVPWQTLLFRPQPDHYGAKNPPDHLLLDLFWSPVIEPEPLSKPFETAGKINLNHELLPFRHIKRATALHAAMKAEAVTAIPDDAASNYKSSNNNDEAKNRKFRHFIDATATLKLWKENVFDTGKVFLTASQVCEQPLVPEGVVAPGEEPSNEAIDAFWQTHRLTGDNTKERPYAHLYSRLTTRSNTFRVHFIAQSLVKARSTDYRVFDSTRDRVTATVRGSCLLQRELNMEHPDIPDYMAAPPTNGDGAVIKPLDAFYRWHKSALKTVQ